MNREKQETGQTEKSSSLPVYVLILIVLAAVLVRAWYFMDFRNVPYFDYYLPGFDQVHFDKGAVEIADGNIIGPLNVEKHAVIYKYFLAIIYAIFGRNFSAVWIIQFGLGIATALLIAAATNLATGKKPAALVAGIWYALYGPGIFYEAMELRTFMITFLLALVMYLLIKIKASGKGYIALAIALSALMQTQPNTIILASIVFAYVFITKPISGRKFIFFTVAFIAASLPLLIRSAYVHGRFVFYDYSGPFVLLLGNLPDYSGFGWMPSPSYQEYIATHDIESFGEAITFALGKISSTPVAFLTMYFRKFYLFFSGFEVPSNMNVYLVGEQARVAVTPWSNFALITGIAVGGIVLSGRIIRRRWSVFIIPLGYLASVLPFYPAARFRAPASAALILLASAGIVGLIEVLKEKRYLRSIIAVGLSILVGLALYFPLSGAQTIRPLDLKNQGKAFLANENRRDPVMAEKLLRRAWDAYVLSNEPTNDATEILPGLLIINGAALLQNKDIKGAEERFLLATRINYSMSASIEGMIKINLMKPDPESTSLWKIRLASIKGTMPDKNDIDTIGLDNREVMLIMKFSLNPGDIESRLVLAAEYESSQHNFLSAAQFHYTVACQLTSNLNACKKAENLRNNINRSKLAEL